MKTSNWSWCPIKWFRTLQFYGLYMVSKY